MTLLTNPWLNAFLIVAIFWAASYVVTILMSFLARFTAKTKTSLDDDLINAGKLPIRYLAILIGMFLAGKNFDFTITMKEQIYGLADLFFVEHLILV